MLIKLLTCHLAKKLYNKIIQFSFDPTCNSIVLMLPDWEKNQQVESIPESFSNLDIKLILC